MQRPIAILGVLSALLPAVLLAVSAAPAAAVPDVTDACIANWSDAAPIVAREKLLAAREIQRMSRRTLPGDVVRITLCREDAGYVYLLLLRDGKGRISNLKIDAHGDGLR